MVNIKYRRTYKNIINILFAEKQVKNHSVHILWLYSKSLKKNFSVVSITLRCEHNMIIHPAIGVEYNTPLHAISVLKENKT